MAKGHRRLPEEYTSKNANMVFDILGEVEICSRAVSVSRFLSQDKSAPKYSNADIELFIARLKVAKESLIEDIDKHIHMFQLLLGD